MVAPFGSIKNTMVPDSGAVLLGRGELMLALINPATGLPDASGFETMGNVSEFSLNATSETFERTNYLNAKAIVDLKIVLNQAISVTIVADEATAENIARFTAGKVSADYTSPLGTAVSNKEITQNVRKGATYQLLGASNTPLLGISLVGSPAPTLVVEVDDNSSYTSATALTLGTDYVLNSATGSIRLLTGSAVNFTTNRYMRFTYTPNSATAKTYTQTSPLTGEVVQAYMRFEGKNANGGTSFVLDFFKVSITADGDLSLIGQESANLSFTGSLESNPLAKAAYGCESEFGRFFAA